MKELEVYDSASADEAVSDVMIVIGMMWKDHESFIKTKEPLDIYISNLVASDDILEQFNKGNEEEEKL